jgi:hypothetical protein
MPKAKTKPKNTLQLRLYCHGLGDCNLIGVPDTDGGTFWILIDCGIHTSAKGGTERIRSVVDDIFALTPRLDVVVGTHEHWDHISGFLQAEDLFGKFDIGEIWFGWTENPADQMARKLDRFKGDALAALVDITLRLDGDRRFGADAKQIDSMMGFVFGLKGERVRDAREKLRGLSNNVLHLEPGSIVPLPDKAKAVNIYVLGPPRNETLLGINDSKTETYSVADRAPSLPEILRNNLELETGRMRIKDDPLAPFDEVSGIKLTAIFDGKPTEDKAVQLSREFLSEHYAGPALVDPSDKHPNAPKPDQQWRRIDSDWLGAGVDLALQLDARTNNTSLVLAIEIVATKKVLIFAADAQVGNWQSWAGVDFVADGTKGADLLKRTVFYKVGHHGSRNATLSENGLELMDSPELTAFIPTDEVMAKKVGWSDIPAVKLLERLKQKTGGRLIQSDAQWIQEVGHDIAVKPGGSIKDIKLHRGTGAAFEGAPYIELQIG